MWNTAAFEKYQLPKMHTMFCPSLSFQLNACVRAGMCDSVTLRVCIFESARVLSGNFKSIWHQFFLNNNNKTLTLYSPLVSSNLSLLSPSFSTLSLPSTQRNLFTIYIKHISSVLYALQTPTSFLSYLCKQRCDENEDETVPDKRGKLPETACCLQNVLVKRQTG